MSFILRNLCMVLARSSSSSSTTRIDVFTRTGCLPSCVRYCLLAMSVSDSFTPNMSRTVLGVYDDAGPVLIRTSHGTSKPTSQYMAVLGSVMVYAQGLGHPVGSILKDDCRISFRRSSPSLMLCAITTSKLTNEAALQKFLEVVYFTLQMLIGPSELETIAGVNTTNDTLRRALTGVSSVLDALIERHTSSPLRIIVPQVTLVPHKPSAPIFEALHHLSQEADTEYAALVYDNVYAMATHSFWRLHPEELVVLQMLLHSVPDSSTLAQIPVHLPHTSSEGSWYLMVAALTSGCRLVMLTNNDTSLAQLQALVPQVFGVLKPQLVKASSSAVSQNLHSLQAFILHQQHPDCMMVSSCPHANHVQQQPGLSRVGSGGQGKCDFRTSNAIKHQQALGTLSAFAAAICEQMQMDSQHEPDAQGAEVTQAFAEVAGLRLAAVSEQREKSRRTLFAVLNSELSRSPEKELAQQLLSLLKHLPLIGTIS